jgi:multiple sugar transport system permease protein
MMKHTLVKILVYTILIVLCVVWLFPLASSLIVISKDMEDFNTLPFWQPVSIVKTFKNLATNFLTAWKEAQIGFAFLNTAIYALGAGIGSAIMASLAGYAMVHTTVKAPQAWFIGIFIGNLFPFQLFLIPLYFVLKALHLYDTRIGLVIAYIGICVPFALFVFRNYAHTLPAELFDAAKVDGASRWGAYARIFLPMSRPAFAVVFTFQFIWTWNDLLFAMVLSEKYRPIMNTLGMLSGARGAFPPPVIVMGSVIASLPTIILLLSLQRTFIRGFTLTAEK